ncbi:MAG: serine protease, partial [Chloroflexota bacterium]
LDPAEAFALEAIVMLEGRPAVFIQDGHFFPAPGDWQVLEAQRAAIETVCHSVGRVEVTGHPSYDWVGTGFLVAPDVIMTNRHVAEVFCETLNGRKWRFKMGMTSRVDYVEELAAMNSAEFALTDVVGIHRAFDMALLRVAQTSSGGGPSPAPLAVSATPPSSTQDHQVYAIGYPAWDGRRNDPQEMMRIFSNVFNVKRLLPGEITQYLPQGVFMHDCSTLGGNSGSCVVDLETHRVLGLHFGGRYLEGNYAVALWQLTGDPLLQRAQVFFQ